MSYLSDPAHRTYFRGPTHNLHPRRLSLILECSVDAVQILVGLQQDAINAIIGWQTVSWTARLSSGGSRPQLLLQISLGATLWSYFDLLVRQLASGMWVGLFNEPFSHLQPSAWILSPVRRLLQKRQGRQWIHEVLMTSWILISEVRLRGQLVRL